VHDGESRVAAILKKSGVRLSGFARFALGEGAARPAAEPSASVA
jgi:elongation factor Ts